MRLRDGTGLELRWWWDEPPAGRRVAWDDPAIARARVGALLARPGLGRAARRFLAAGAVVRGADLEDGELVTLLAAAVASGRVRVGEGVPVALRSWGDEEEAEETAPTPVARAPEPAPSEEICWPCLRAAASARALREASKQGAPFIRQD
jgi:hypothetical protein